MRATSTAVTPMMMARFVSGSKKPRSTISHLAPIKPLSHLTKEKTKLQSVKPNLLWSWCFSHWCGRYWDHDRIPGWSSEVSRSHCSPSQQAWDTWGPLKTKKNNCSWRLWPASGCLVFLEVATHPVHAVALVALWTVGKVAIPWIRVWAGSSRTRG